MSARTEHAGRRALAQELGRLGEALRDLRARGKNQKTAVAEANRRLRAAAGPGGGRDLPVTTVNEWFPKPGGSREPTVPKDLADLWAVVAVMLEWTTGRSERHVQREFPRWKELYADARRGTGMDEEVRGYLAAARKAAEKHPYQDFAEPPSLVDVYVRQRSRPAVRDGRAGPGDGPATGGGGGAGAVVPFEPAEAVFRRADRMCVLVAGPGVGKSTLLRARLRDTAGVLLDDTHSPGTYGPAVPVWVSAHALVGEDRHVPDVLADATGKLGTFGRHPVLTRDRFLRRPWTGAHWHLLVDDLDELPDARMRRAVLEKLANAVAADPPLYRCVVATRPLAEGELDVLDHVLGLRTPHYELQPFTSHDLHTYLEKYFGTRWPREEATRHARHLAGALREGSLDEAARVPLMAFMLCRLYLAEPGRSLPDGRAAVYEDFTDLLYQNNQSKQVARSHEESIRHLVESVQSPRARAEAEAAARQVHERLPELIGYLAHRRLADHGTPITEALASHEAVRRPGKVRPERWEAFLENLLRHTGLLVHRADGLGFPHQGFLEYHAAADIRHRLTVECSLTEDALVDQVYGEHWADPTWHETLVLVAGMVEPRLAGRIVDHLLAADPLWFLRRTGASSDVTPQHIVLAAKCLGEVREPGGELGVQCSAVVDAVIALIEYVVEKRAFPGSALSRALAETLPPVLGRIGAADSAAAQRYHAWYRVYGRFLNVMREGANFVWFEVPPAARLGAALLRDDEGFREGLFSRAVFDPVPAGREEALRALIQERPDDPQLAELLREFAGTDPDGDVRRGSLRLLALARPRDRSIGEWLERCLTDDDRHLRQGALAALADGRRGEPGALALIRRSATDDPDDSVRLSALESLARGWPRDPDAAAVVRDRATRDPDPHLRTRAFHILAEGRPDDPPVAPAPARSAPPPPAAEDPRHTVLKPLVVDRRSDARTPVLLRELAEEHPDDEVRVAAVWVLATTWHTHPRTLPWLCELAASGAGEPVRRAALRAVGSGWPGRPDAEALLRGVAEGRGGSRGRVVAVLALAGGWHDDPATGSLLRGLAGDDDEFVRAAAVLALGTGWRDHPDTVARLEDRAENDTAPHVRRNAVHALVTGFRTQRTADLLRRLAVDDPDDHLRAAVVHDLAAGWRDPGTGALLRRIVTGGTGPISRGAAVGALAGGWRDDPATEELLRERAADDSDWQLQRTAVTALADRWPYDPQIHALAERLADDW
ncbi:HEAT repeat domain-containing protein [Kitasatospora sp. NPDC101447]|uniref:HEAT repeat domain-containing protein n=1 Tax=Kitasatospora sp. NPDC101447 TaxID=3364102 RepID=UPI0038296C6E